MKAEELLFETSYNGKRLFKNQLELVYELLHTPGSAYDLENMVEPASVLRAQGRLKTYISQLLSESVVRTVTEDFKNSLKLVLGKKINNEEFSNDLSKQIIEALELKNASSLSKSENQFPRDQGKQSLEVDIKSANYISVFTSKPMNMEKSYSETGFPIRKYFFEDLIAQLESKLEFTKYYRFNFPTKAYCEIFWLGLEKMLFQHLIDPIESEPFISFLYNSKFLIKTETYNLYNDYISIKQQHPEIDLEFLKKEVLATITKNIIEILNRNKTILVFFVDAPVFSIPLVAINPNETSAKVYGLIDFDPHQWILYKYNSDNMLLWRLFVWDQLKADKSGESIIYPELALHMEKNKLVQKELRQGNERKIE